MGKMEMNLRAYAWTQKEIDQYKKLKMKEDHDLIATLSNSLKDAMDALGGDLEKYLEEAGEVVKREKEGKKEENKIKRPGILDPFLAAFSIGGPKQQKPKTEKKPAPSAADKMRDAKEKSAAKDNAIRVLWECYKNFKKAHGLVAW
jgi:hypothetical protein